MNFETSDTNTPAEFINFIRGPYTISSRGLLSDEQATTLVQKLRVGVEAHTPSVLGGRSQAGAFDLPPLGRVFVKHYSHGGLLRAVTGGRFFGVGPARSQAEFEMLERVRAYGVDAPRPIAIVKRGGVVYSTWLVMEELEGARSLVEIQAEDGDAMHRAMDALSEQLKILINHRVLHVDLHPGNVLVCHSGKVYIVDFDKAHYFRGSAQALRELYLRRWRRAVIKHGLSPILSEMMSLTLRSYDD
jgi:3-deoxy-D-manno-octulosonic acid kinase